MGQWMIYATAVAVLLALAIRLMEGTFAHTGRARWIWMVGLGVAVALPFVRPLLAPVLVGWWVGSGGSSDLIALGVPQVVAGLMPQPERMAAMARYMGAAWVGGTLSLVGVTLLGALRLRSAREGWPPKVVDGTEVLVSADVGPAVVGLLRPRIVLPAWVLDLPAAQRTLIIAHEVEHLRGRDPLLLASGMVAAVLMPWNAGVWWAFARLRHAVETDCDHRVLRARRDHVADYAELLLQVGTRSGRPVPLGAGFGEHTSSLERRIRTMVRGREVGWRGAAVRMALAVGLVVAACAVDEPDNALPTEAEPVPVIEAETEADLPAQVVERQPTVTAFTVAPAISNRGEIVEAMESEYPPLLRDAGIGGTVRVFFFIDETGAVTDVRVDESSGHDALDQAAVRVAQRFRFSAARDGDKPVSVWISIPITFQVR